MEAINLDDYGEGVMVLTKDDVISLLRTKNLCRRGLDFTELYRSREGSWHLTFGRGDVDKAIVHELLSDKTIVRKWDDVADFYVLSPTLTLDGGE